MRNWGRRPTSHALDGRAFSASLVVFWICAVCACQAPVDERIEAIYELKADPTSRNIEKIRKQFDDADRDIRATALNALVQLEVPDAEDLALRAAADEDGFVRATAAKLLGDLDSVGSAGTLAELLRTDSDPIVRQRAAETLLRLEGEVAVAALADGLDDPMQNVRLAAVRGVRSLDPAADVPRLARLVLEDAVWEIRVQAARALGASGDRSVIPVLEAALSDSNEFVRTAAAEGLKDVRDSPEDDPEDDPEG
ncbi:MAG: hypothetical protein GY716_04425 [bacterium]|nr:hypothetical protein [bacterium]